MSRRKQNVVLLLLGCWFLLASSDRLAFEHRPLARVGPPPAPTCKRPSYEDLCRPPKSSDSVENSQTCRPIRCRRDESSSTSENRFLELVDEPESLENRLNSSTSESPCVAVIFYADWCPFSAKAAPAFNALPRVYPDLKFVAYNASIVSSINSRFGIMGLPTILLFHRGWARLRFNVTFSLENLIDFINNRTDLTPRLDVQLTDDDYRGPLPSRHRATYDYALTYSVAFLTGFVAWTAWNSRPTRQLRLWFTRTHRDSNRR
ncbi:thioredoxin domain-containing protein 15-like [Oscarella lobularis]|uniref:thioredoxin domain-containing protein 15-like n=1 Tax=Oscarella lobularis TaxID=121494 RepID=UPI003313E91B